MSRKLIGYLLFFVVLVVAFYYFLFKGTDNWKVKLPTLSYVKPFMFKSQDGVPVTEKDLLGKVTVVEYFFYHLQRHLPENACRDENCL